MAVGTPRHGRGQLARPRRVAHATVLNASFPRGRACGRSPRRHRSGGTHRHLRAGGDACGRVGSSVRGIRGVVPFVGKPDVSRSFRRPSTQPRPALVPKRRRVAGSGICPCRDGAEHAGTRPARVIADDGRISGRLSLRACPARRAAGAAVLRLPHHASRIKHAGSSPLANTT